MKVNVIDTQKQQIYSAILEEGEHGVALTPDGGEEDESNPYLSPGWIDFHTHIYHGMTSFGIYPDRIGLCQGVHLLVDAGSSGAETFEGLRIYVAGSCRTKIRAFLNISEIGLVTMREYADMRRVSVERAVSCMEENRDFYCGIKVRSSGTIVEDKGLEPLKRTIEAAERAGCPVLVHMGENPPSNEENLALLRKGDIISHCFHGKEKPLWNEDGTPILALAKALDRGVILDLGHGAASYSHAVACAAIGQGNRDFIISTDLHGRSVNGPVYSLAHTMSKVYAAGLTKLDLLTQVTRRPAEILGLRTWCGQLEKEATLFTMRPRTDGDLPFVDSLGNPIAVTTVVEPFANIVGGRLEYIGKGERNGAV